MMDEDKFMENYKKKLVKDFVKQMLKHFKIYNNDDNLVNESEILNIIYAPKVINRCIGTTSTGIITQCTRNAVDKLEYCKTHMYKMGYIKEQPPINIVCIENKCKDTIVCNLKKKFINNSFYFVDEKYIYDEDNNKVGYINDKEYILSSDPFILN